MDVVHAAFPFLELGDVAPIVQSGWDAVAPKGTKGSAAFLTDEEVESKFRQLLFKAGFGSEEGWRAFVKRDGSSTYRFIE